MDLLVRLLGFVGGLGGLDCINVFGGNSTLDPTHPLDHFISLVLIVCVWKTLQQSDPTNCFTSLIDYGKLCKTILL